VFPLSDDRSPNPPVFAVSNSLCRLACSFCRLPRVFELGLRWLRMILFSVRYDPYSERHQVVSTLPLPPWPNHLEVVCCTVSVSPFKLQVAFHWSVIGISLQREFFRRISGVHVPNFGIYVKCFLSRLPYKLIFFPFLRRAWGSRRAVHCFLPDLRGDFLFFLAFPPPSIFVLCRL